MKIIALKDIKDRGYTAYHTDFPSVVVQTETIEEIPERLSNIFQDIMKNTMIEIKEIKNIADEK